MSFPFSQEIIEYVPNWQTMCLVLLFFEERCSWRGQSQNRV